MDGDGEELLDVLQDVLEQACGGGPYRAGLTKDEIEGRLDSIALSAYARGLRLLAKHKRFEIESQYGRRVIGKIIQGDKEGKV